MASRNRLITVFPANGGLNSADPADVIQASQWSEAINVEYTNTGLPRKRGGTTRYNSSALQIGGSDSRLSALADFWRYDVSAGVLTGTQKFVAVATTASGGIIVKDDGDGTWDTLKTGWGDNDNLPSITLAQGFAVFFNGESAPQKWDQTTLSDLNASAPAASGGSYHLRRMFTAGHAATANSTSNYSAAGDITDWTGADTGTFIFDENDGDYLVGVSKPFRGRLFFFKGPNYGSIHEVAGTSPATFTKNRIAVGSPAVHHRGIVTTDNDVMWPSLRGIHSLAATQKYGDTEAAIISRPIQDQFDGMTEANLRQIYGFHHPAKNLVGWIIPANTDNAVVFNYLTGQWSTWRFATQTVWSAMGARTPTTGVARVYFGTAAGFVLAGDQSTKTDVQGGTNTSILCRLTSPIFYSIAEAVVPHIEKQLHSVSTVYKPQTTGAATITYYRDGTAASDTYTLDMTVGAGDSAVDSGKNIEGRCRGIQIQWSQDTAGHDLELHGYVIRLTPAEDTSTEGTA